MKIKCNWCGKPSEVHWQGETLCEHCWKWIIMEADKKQNQQEIQKHFMVEDDIIANESNKKV